MLSLILPVLIPSWRFFKSIEPSPRVQWVLLAGKSSKAPEWQEFRPRAQSETLLHVLRRLIWNPVWNESLFVVSCAERIYHALPDPHDGAQDEAERKVIAHSVNEIRSRILRDLTRRQIDTAQKQLQFRLVFVHRTGDALTEEIVYQSDRFATAAPSKGPRP